MPADPKVLGLRRVYQTELSLLLSHFYHELDGTELSREARYSEIVKLLEDETDKLSRMGIPPAWERPPIEEK